MKDMISFKINSSSAVKFRDNFCATCSSYFEHTLQQRISFMDLPYETNPLGGVETADTRSLARAIDAASWSVFLHVPFAEWVLKATGRNTHLVDMFLWYHEMLSVRLYYRLRRCSEAQKVKNDLLEIISEVNPFARTVISSGIESLNGRPATCDLNISFIIGPLCSLPTDDLAPDVLNLLDIRFRRTYHRQWDNDEMADHTPPGLLASSITENDLRSFRDGYALTFMEGEGFHKWLGSLGRSWNYRCEDVADCLQVDSKHSAALVELAVVSINAAFLLRGSFLTDQKYLYERRNFHGSTAIFYGLKQAGCDGKMIPLQLSSIVNYRAYRDELKKGPALPFVFLSIRELPLLTECLSRHRPSSPKYEMYWRSLTFTVEELFVFRSYIADTSKATAAMQRIRKLLNINFCFCF
ncbi:hypothetical protein EMCG_06808 [[Emmonsia] crescens]|uniref:Uncharacterized protein n=1 Tax=[Emmonsia] crescens TaxID=73230 RepID=A0A0G2J6C8_9EURO|nr:hypothetical protein EMCG_06808 [Emmonsia crescens UAMH 3008]